jgi:hypothetical protein
MLDPPTYDDRLTYGFSLLDPLADLDPEPDAVAAFMTYSTSASTSASAFLDGMVSP